MNEWKHHGWRSGRAAGPSTELDLGLFLHLTDTIDLNPIDPLCVAYRTEQKGPCLQRRKGAP